MTFINKRIDKVSVLMFEESPYTIRRGSYILVRYTVFTYLQTTSTSSIRLRKLIDFVINLKKNGQRIYLTEVSFLAVIVVSKILTNR